MAALVVRHRKVRGASVILVKLVAPSDFPEAAVRLITDAAPNASE